MKRITEKPIRKRFNVVESAANTYTELELSLPVAVLESKVQGVEIMKIFPDTSAPDLEDSQSNVVECALLKDSDTAIPDYDDKNVIYRTKRENQHIKTTSGGAAQLTEDQRDVDLTDGDGNGEIFMERSVYAAIKGTGNAAAKRFQGYFLYHLVEMDGDEVAVQAFADDQG
jgi:hypothetical protein